MKKSYRWLLLLVSLTAFVAALLFANGRHIEAAATMLVGVMAFFAQSYFRWLDQDSEFHRIENLMSALDATIGEQNSYFETHENAPNPALVYTWENALQRQITALESLLGSALSYGGNISSAADALGSAKELVQIHRGYREQEISTMGKPPGRWPMYVREHKVAIEAALQKIREKRQSS